MTHPQHRIAIAVLLVLALALTACGSDDDVDTDDTSTSEPDSSTDPGDETPPSDDEPSDGGDYSSEDAGSATVRVDGVEYPDFVGDCSISRGLDPDTYEPVPVGDLSTPGLNVVVGIDNVASGPDVEANFIMTSETDFRMTGLGGSGTIDSIAYFGPRATVGSTELALVAFSGTTDDGIAVVAEVVCEIGLG